MEPAHVHQAGGVKDVTSAVRMGHMAWTVKSAVTAAMLMDVTTLQDTAAAWLGGLVSTVTVCVLRAAGAPTAHSPVTVRMGHPAPLMRAHVSALQGTEAPPVRGSALLGTLVTAAVRPVHSVFTATGHATMCQDSVTAYPASKGHCVMRCAPVVTLGRTVLGAAVAPTMEPVTPLMGRASVTLVGSEVTVLSLVLQVSGAPTASIHVTVITGPTAVHTTESANAHQDGRGFTAHSAVHWVSMEKTALRLVSAGMEPTVTTSLDNVPAAQGSWDATVSKNVHQVHMAMGVVKFATVLITPPVIT